MDLLMIFSLLHLKLDVGRDPFPAMGFGSSDRDPFPKGTWRKSWPRVLCRMVSERNPGRMARSGDGALQRAPGLGGRPGSVVVGLQGISASSCVLELRFPSVLNDAWQ